jgi:DNA polymerase-3 subunit epsilon/CBS domain-containing protein
MAKSPRPTQLLAVEAVALDLETTGLDVRSARIVQIGAVRLSRGSVDDGCMLSTLVDPGVPIPASATGIHGISTADVSSAPKPGEALAALREFVEGRPLVGHMLGFDLAVIAAEAKRAGAEAISRPFLDTRLLGEVAIGSLPEYTLETLAATLGVVLEGRHTAIGDAMTAARIFCALLPHLRARGVRTWAEAEAACRNLRREPSAIDEGWVEIRSPQVGDVSGSLARIDSYPYRHRVADIMTSPPRYVDPQFSLLQAARTMTGNRISSAFVKDGARTGILTERDVLRATAAAGPQALTAEAIEFASFPLASVAAEDFVYRAIARMARLKVRHLGVTDATGAVVGALSARDLLKLRASDAIQLGDAVETAKSVAELAAAWAPLPLVAEALLAEDVDAVDIAAVISHEIGAATSRAAVLAEETLASAGEMLPCPYAILVLGSAGRGESLLALDQDNAIVFQSGRPDGPEDRYFAKLGAAIADALDAIGVPYCKGGVMAREPAWRGSVDTWRARIAGWLTRSKPEDLLSVDIFFDAKAVHGTARLAEIVLADARSEASRAPHFVKLLAAATPPPPAALGLLGGIRTDGGRIDLKRAALLAIVSSARVLSIRHQIGARSTQGRLKALEELGRGGQADLAALCAAHETVLASILVQQIRDIHAGIPPSNRVEIGRATRRKKNELREALRTISILDTLVRDLMF